MPASFLSNICKAKHMAYVKTKDTTLKELAYVLSSFRNQNFNYFVEDNNSRKVEINDLISDSCVRSITRIIANLTSTESGI